METAAISDAIGLLAVMTHFTHLTNDFAIKFAWTDAHDETIHTHAHTHTHSIGRTLCEYMRMRREAAISIQFYFRTWTLSLAIFGERMDANGRGESRGKKVDWETGIKRMNEMISIYMYSRPLFSPKLNIVSKFSSVIEWCFCTWCRWLLYMRCWQTGGQSSKHVLRYER